MSDPHGQPSHRLRLDWGPTGADAVAMGAEVVVVVDVLSFTTTLSVATDGGTLVWPHAGGPASAAALGDRVGAQVAAGRRTAGPGEVSLSPVSLRVVDALPPRLVLPSPNGSTIAARCAAGGAVVLGGCLRDADAVAGWVGAHTASDAVVAVVAAGERWPDGSLRPAVEDLWGAGAVLGALLDQRPTSHPSPEVLAAVAAYASVRGHEREQLLACASGLELVAGGFGADVEVAAEVGAARGASVMRHGRFEPAR